MVTNFTQPTEAPVQPLSESRPRLPAWLRRPLPTADAFGRTRALLDELKLHTVCESAKCPNHWECWSRGTATFMIGGDRCTRACGFCAVTTAKPFPLDADEPGRVAEATRRMRLRHVVITGVARDDLPDGGAAHFRRTIEAVRQLNPGIVIEVLTPDFLDRDASIAAVLSARPHVFNHNLETVRRLTPRVRSRATYDRSLSVLRKAKALDAGAPTPALRLDALYPPVERTVAPERGSVTRSALVGLGTTKVIQPEHDGEAAAGHRPALRGQVPEQSRLFTKSGLMLGLGEEPGEVLTALRDLREVGCDILTLGQYLQPGLQNLPVVEFVSPERFAWFGAQARGMGFLHVASAPLVRSSYHADDFPAASDHV